MTYVNRLERKYLELFQLVSRLQNAGEVSDKLLGLNEIDLHRFQQNLKHEIEDLEYYEDDKDMTKSTSNDNDNDSMNNDSTRDNLIQEDAKNVNGSNGDKRTKIKIDPNTKVNGLDDNDNDNDNDNEASVYGPTSIYDNDLISKKKTLTDEYKIISQLNKDPQILQCLKLFFTWQYPDLNMFIFREAFLQEFFNPKLYNLYCSKILILSISALGAKMADDETTYSNSIMFYNEAKSLLLNKLNNPSITSLQSYLLLSFYDIFNGANSSGWMLSGNAIRMGFDLGFQLHPDSWFLKQKLSNYSKEIDIEIKSRIYWGTYLADHFISLILGRPSLLKLSDATIPETDDLPELEWIDEFRYLDEVDKSQNTTKKVSNISNPLKNVINLINISDNMLNDIFNKNFNQEDFQNNSMHFHSTLIKLNEYNEKILNWKLNLPEDLKFNKSLLIKSGDNPTLSCIRYYYYILILCLNRPFIGLDAESFNDLDFKLTPRSICLEAIDELYYAINKFKVVHGLKKLSIFIVYVSILAISILLLLNTSQQDNAVNTEKLKFFLIVLKLCSRTWKLASKSFVSITSKLSSYENINISLEDLIDDDFALDENDYRTPGAEAPNDNMNLGSEIPLEAGFSPLESQARKKSITPYFDDLSRNGSPRFTSQPMVKSNSKSELGSILNTSSLDSELQPAFANQLQSGESFPHSEIPHEKQPIFPAMTEDLEFFGGPPVLMTSDLFNQDWESLFPDYTFNEKNPDQK